MNFFVLVFSKVIYLLLFPLFLFPLFLFPLFLFPLFLFALFLFPLFLFFFPPITSGDSADPPFADALPPDPPGNADCNHPNACSNAPIIYIIN